MLLGEGWKAQTLTENGSEAKKQPRMESYQMVVARFEVPPLRVTLFCKISRFLGKVEVDVSVQDRTQGRKIVTRLKKAAPGTKRTNTVMITRIKQQYKQQQNNAHKKRQQPRQQSRRT